MTRFSRTSLLVVILFAGCITIHLPSSLQLLIEPGLTTIEAEINKTVEGNNQFALDLYAVLQKRKGNLFLSPYSMSTALAMTYAGARGRTAEEMADTLHFSLPPERLHPAFSKLFQLSQDNNGNGCQLNIANLLWNQRGHALLPDFLKVTTKYYGAGVGQVDFNNSTEEARGSINSWVEQQTRNKIKELLTPGSVNGDTRLVLTNAIYFHGDWAVPFKETLTKHEPFHVTADRSADVPLMSQRHAFPYLEGNNVQMLALPYKNRRLSMVLLLPKREIDLTEFEQSLRSDQLGTWISQMRRQEVDVFLPKFKITKEFYLSDALASLGMTSAFDRQTADFSGMDGRDKSAPDKLYLSQVIHQAVVEVTEGGTEATAATAVVCNPTATPPRCPPPPPPPLFRADHPFLFLIRDNLTGSILFMGRFAEPRP